MIGVDGPPLWRATVPVFDGVLARLDAALEKAEAALGPNLEAALQRRPDAGMLPAARQVATAVQFTLRVAFPLAGQRPPELREPLDAAGLRARIAAARALLLELDPAAFEGAEARAVRAVAGFADAQHGSFAALVLFAVVSAIAAPPRPV